MCRVCYLVVKDVVPRTQQQVNNLVKAFMEAGEELNLSPFLESFGNTKQVRVWIRGKRVYIVIAPGLPPAVEISQLDGALDEEGREVLKKFVNLAKKKYLVNQVREVLTRLGAENIRIEEVGECTTILAEIDEFKLGEVLDSLGLA